MIKAVIFDSDGMLLHGRRFSDSYSAEFKISIEKMAPFFAGPFKNCLVGKADLKEELVEGGWLGKWGWKGTVGALLEYWFSTGINADSEIFESVKDLKKKGIIVLLASNQEKYRMAFVTKKFGYDTLFDNVFCSSGIGHKKVEPEFLEAVMQYLTSRDISIKKSEVLFWDDRDENIEAVRNFGMEACKFSGKADYFSKMSGILETAAVN